MIIAKSVFLCLLNLCWNKSDAVLEVMSFWVFVRGEPHSPVLYTFLNRDKNLNSDLSPSHYCQM